MGRNYTVSKRVGQAKDKDKAFVELCQIAQESIMSALEDGAKHGYDGEWRGLSVNDHLYHANVHATEAYVINHVEDHSRSAALPTEIAHGVCRLLMSEHRRRTVAREGK